MTPTDRTATATATATDRWHLQDERDFLVRSLADAEREHEAGDLNDEDYALLRRRDLDRLEAVDAALRELDVQAAVRAEAAPAATDSAGAADPAGAAARSTAVGSTAVGRAIGRVRGGGAEGRSPDSRRRRRWWLAAGGTAAVLAAVIVLVLELTSPRLPGDQVSGSIDLSTQAQVQRALAQAADLENQRHVVQALQLYQQILAKDPNQPEALAERGWIVYEGGLASSNRSALASGRASVEKALRLEPKAYAPHLYLGTIDLQQEQVSQAVAQYQQFLALQPPKQLVKQAATYIRSAYTQAGQPVPPGL